jgi:hypothetical protein
MALYCEITDLVKVGGHSLSVEFTMYDDATTPPTVVMANASTGFSVVNYDANGAIIPETSNQKRQRMKAEYDAYTARLMDMVTNVNTHFDALKQQAIGYRNPPAV